MTEADRIFDRFPTFIREYIYQRGWDHLRDVQLKAARVILDSDDNLLLSSSTASGKTEAAFFPILAHLYDHPSDEEGASVLYIAPLKSLLNDQFLRLDELLDLSGVSVTHWHGDVGVSHKSAFLKRPSGILQITPESLESMLINRSNDIPRLFGALRFVVIDEIHTMIGTDRGNQVICQLCRIARLLGRHPRRIGLSATIGDLATASEWLGGGTGRNTQAPSPGASKLHWRLGFEHFYISDTEMDQTDAAEREATAKGARAADLSDAGYAFLYDSVKNKKSLVFSNSREETEYVTATLRQLAKARGEQDVFLIHHGNLSAALREDAELKMKDESVARAVTCATVTMELGIDIGKLERVAQMGAPNTVSSFLQRLGRSGRRGSPPELIELFREEMPLPNAPLPQLIPWDLLQGIAIVELYTKERFIEPPRIRSMPMSLAFHQTLSILAASGELQPQVLAHRVLSLPPMAHMSKEVYRLLLLSMIEKEFLEITEQKGLIIGLKGEKVIGNFKFYAVFRDSEDYTVRCESDEIGTITTPPPVGDRFALAGRVWEVLDADMPRKLIYVKRVEGKMEISWPGDGGEIHTRILEKMREILFSDDTYPYLLPNAAQRLENARHVATNTGMDGQMLVRLSDSSFCLFPWLGTRSFRTVRRFLRKHASQFGLSDIESERCYYITFKARSNTPDRLMELLGRKIAEEGIDKLSLMGESECPVFDKYDDYIPPELLREAYAKDRMDDLEMIERLQGGTNRGNL